MCKQNDKKKAQLGISPGTAANRLKKSILFDLVNQLDVCWCYQCGARIDDIDTFTIEHKVPWLDSDNPQELYFDLGNIAFSHASCNYGAARKKRSNCPSISKYRRGCRCEGCKGAISDYKKKRREYLKEAKKNPSSRRGQSQKSRT